MGLLGVLELLHGQDGGALVSLDLLGVVHHEGDGDQGGHSPQNEAETDDDGLVDLDADAGEGVNSGTNGERVDRGTKAAAASAEQDGGGADQRVEAGGHHGGGEQGVERHGLLTHTIGGTTEGEDEHQDGDQHDLAALELLDQNGNAVIQGAGLGHHAEEAAEDHNEQADGQSVCEALHRGGEEVARTGSGNGAAGGTGNDDGDNRNDSQQEQKNGER